MTGDWREKVQEFANTRPFFDESIVQATDCYVAWVDALGTKSVLLTSHARAVNFVMKIHAACLDAERVMLQRRQTRPAGPGAVSVESDDGPCVADSESDTDRRDRDEFDEFGETRTGARAAASDSLPPTSAGGTFGTRPAALAGEQPEISIGLFPMNDGVYIVSRKQGDLREFLHLVFRRLVTLFVLETNPFHRFMVRGAIAYGPISCADQLHGKNHTLRTQVDYIRGIVLGMPLAQAYDAERNAPPFGFAVHESARGAAAPGDRPMHCVFWQWWSVKADEALLRGLTETITEHFTWCKAHPMNTMYAAEALRRHEELAREYYFDVQRAQ